MTEAHDEMEFFWPDKGAAAAPETVVPPQGPPPETTKAEPSGMEPPEAVPPGTIAAPGPDAGADVDGSTDGVIAPAGSSVAPVEPSEPAEVAEAQAEELTDTIAALMEFLDAVAQEERTGPTPGALEGASPPPEQDNSNMAAGAEPAARPKDPKDFALDLQWDPNEDWDDAIAPPPTPDAGQAPGAIALDQSWTVEAQPIPKAPPPASDAPGDRGGGAPNRAAGPLAWAEEPPLGAKATPNRADRADAIAISLEDGQEVFGASPRSDTPGEAGAPKPARRAARSGDGADNGPGWRVPLLVAIAAGVGVALWLSGGPRRLLTWQTERDIDRALARSPELAVYRIHATVRGPMLHLAGRVPSAEIRDRAVEVARQVAPELDVDNDILVLPVPPAPGQMAADANRLAAALSQRPGTAIAAAIQGDTAILTGETLEGTDLAAINQQFAAIPGIAAVTNRIALRPLSVPQRIYFQGTSTDIPPPDRTHKLVAVAELLKRYPTHRLVVIGYSHPTENDGTLGLRRAQAVRTALEDLGIDRVRVGVQGPAGLPPGLGSNDLPWLSQGVLFQLVPPPPVGSSPARSPVPSPPSSGIKPASPAPAAGSPPPSVGPSTVPGSGAGSVSPASPTSPSTGP